MGKTRAATSAPPSRAAKHKGQSKITKKRSQGASPRKPVPKVSSSKRPAASTKQVPQKGSSAKASPKKDIPAKGKTPVKKVVSTSAKKTAPFAAKKTSTSKSPAASKKDTTHRRLPPSRKSPQKKPKTQVIPPKQPTVSTVKRASEESSVRKPPTRRVTPPPRKTATSGKSKAPSAALQKAAQVKTKAAKKTRARLAQKKVEDKADNVKESPKKKAEPAKETKEVTEPVEEEEKSKEEVKEAEIEKVAGGEKEETAMEVESLEQMTEDQETPQRTTLSATTVKKDATPQLTRIDLTGAKPKFVEQPEQAESEDEEMEASFEDEDEEALSPGQSPARKTETRSAAEQRLMKTLQLNPKQAEELVQALYKQVQTSGGVQYQVSTDEDGNSVLTPILTSKDEAAQEETEVTLDLSDVGMSQVEGEVITSPKKGKTFDMTSARPMAAKRPQQELEGAEDYDENLEGTKRARMQETTEAGTSDETGKKKGVYYVKMKSKEAKDDQGLQEFLEMRKAKRLSEGVDPNVEKSKDGKKSNIIVRCSACKNYFEPGKDFSNHKSECLKLHARCSGCQKYFQRGEEYDNHVAQCTDTAESLALKEQQNEARWEEVIREATEGSETPQKYKCLVCRLPFKNYKETREHEEVCALSVPGEPKGIMCGDCKRTFKGRIYLSRHKTQYPGCPVKPVPLQPPRPSPAVMALQQQKAAATMAVKQSAPPLPTAVLPESSDFNVQVTFHNGQPQVNVKMASDGEDGQGQEKQAASGRTASSIKKMKIEDGGELVPPESTGEKSSTEKFADMTRVKGLKLMDGTPLSKCPLCDKLFKHTEFLKKHFQSFHNLDFEIYVGGKTTDAINRRSQTLQARFRNKRGCTCLDCGDWFVSRLELNLHKRTCNKKITAKVVFPCTLCDDQSVAFQTRVDLYEHMRKVHSEDAQLAQTLNYGCQICHSKFATDDELSRHVHEHHKEGLMDSDHTRRCLDCGMLVEATKLAEHKRQCQDSLVSKPFVCFDCHEQFNTRTELTEHKRSEHLFSGAPYKCWQCFHNFNFYPDLIQHVMDRHRKNRQQAEMMAKAAKMLPPPGQQQQQQQVYKVPSDQNVVRVNIASEDTGGEKSMVLDLSKLRGLMEGEGMEIGRKAGVLTLPASALQALAVDQESQQVVAKPAEVADEANVQEFELQEESMTAPQEEVEQPPVVTAEEIQPSEAAHILIAEAPADIQPAAEIATTEASSQELEPATIVHITRSTLGATPPRTDSSPTRSPGRSPARSPARAKSPAAQAVVTSSPVASSPVARPIMLVGAPLEPNPTAPAAIPIETPPMPVVTTSATAQSPSPRKRHQPAILKRQQTGSPKPSPAVVTTATVVPSQPATPSASNQSQEPRQLLQAVGKDQVMCMACNTILNTMQDVASHKCLTETSAGEPKQWSLQKLEGSGENNEEVEWFVASN